MWKIDEPDELCKKPLDQDIVDKSGNPVYILHNGNTIPKRWSSTRSHNTPNKPNKDSRSTNKPKDTKKEQQKDSSSLEEEKLNQWLKIVRESQRTP